MRVEEIERLLAEFYEGNTSEAKQKNNESVLFHADTY